MNQIDQNYPQEELRSLVKAAVNNIYGLDWEPPVVIQNKIIPSSSLDSIDFTIPVFELAKPTRDTPKGVSNKVVSELLSDKISTEISNKYKLEAIDGYINIELSDSSISNLISIAIDHIAEKQSTKPYDKKHIFFTPDYSFFGGNNLSTANEACRIAEQVYHLSGAEFSTVVLVNDTEGVEGTDILATSQRTHNQCVRLSSRDNSKLTNEFLNRILSGISMPSLFVDDTTDAVYYSDMYINLPIRSSSGRLYPLAHILAQFDKMVLNVDGRQTSIVVILPQRYHLAFNNFLATKRLSHQTDVAVTLFDPKVSRADITTIAASNCSIDSHFQKATNILNNYAAQQLSDIVRRDVIFIASLPYMLGQLIKNDELPRIFDHINQLVEINDRATGLTLQGGVKIPAYEDRLNSEFVLG